MKKFLFLLPLVALLLTGCNEKQGTTSCTLTSNDVINGYSLDAEYIIHYKGDYVEYVELTENVSSDSTDVLDYFEEYAEDTYSTMNSSYGGYTYNITNENGKVVSKTKIDYTKMDLDKLVKDQPLMKAYIKNNKMSKSGLQATYELMGATCK